MSAPGPHAAPTIVLAPPWSGGDAAVRALLGEPGTEAVAFATYVAATDGVEFDFAHARALRDAWRGGAPPVLSHPVLMHPGFADSARTDPLVIARRLRRLLGRVRVVILVDDPVSTVARRHADELGRAGSSRELERWVRDRLRTDHYHGRAPDWILRDADPTPLADAWRRLVGADRVALVRLDATPAPGSPAAGWLGVTDDRLADAIEGVRTANRAKSGASDAVRLLLDRYDRPSPDAGPRTGG